MKPYVSLLITFILFSLASMPTVVQGELWKVFDEISSTSTVVDLTHSFDSNIPHFPLFPAETVTTLFTHEEDGFFAQEFCHVGQWGTHCDPPVHFHAGLRTTSSIPVSEMFLKLVVIDVSEQVQQNPDYTIRMEDIEAWESRHGRVPSGSFVIMRTDWFKRWPDAAAMANKDSEGVAHYPGWSQEVLTYLYEERQITASGHETTDTDPGVATSQDDFSLESYILGLNRFQIELITNTDQVPEAGALLSVSWPKAADGSGFPARLFAIVPSSAPSSAVTLVVDPLNIVLVLFFALALSV